MTQDEILEMARQAHFDSKTWVDIFADNPTVGDVRNYLIAFAELVHQRGYMDGWSDSDEAKTSVSFEMITNAVEAEREACAKVCDSFYESWINIHGRYEFMGEGAQECAAAIRARAGDKND